MNGLCLSVVLIAFLQAPLAGEWQGEIRLPERNGQPVDVRPYQFTFKVEGTKLSGTIQWNNYDFEIGDGEITGNKVRFVQLQRNPSGGISRTFVFEGELNGDELRLTRSQPGNPATGRPPTQPLSFTVRRTK